MLYNYNEKTPTESDICFARAVLNGIPAASIFASNLTAFSSSSTEYFDVRCIATEYRYGNSFMHRKASMHAWIRALR